MTFKSGELLKQLSASFLVAGLSCTNATLFCKSSTTETYRSKNSEALTLMASLLDHDVGTGRRQYNLLSKDSRANTAIAFDEQSFTQPLDDIF